MINKGTRINHVQAEPNAVLLLIIQYSFLTSLWVHMPITRNMLPSAVSSWNLVFIVFRCAPLKIIKKIKTKKNLPRIYKAKLYWLLRISFPPTPGRQNQPACKENGKFCKKNGLSIAVTLP